MLFKFAHPSFKDLTQALKLEETFGGLFKGLNLLEGTIAAAIFLQVYTVC